jgi:hypothetical protein
MALTLDFVVCSNDEVVGNLGEFSDDAVVAWIREVVEGLERLDCVGEVDQDAVFRSWNGGRYAHQCRVLGYERFGDVVCVGGRREAATDGEDADDDAVPVKWGDLTPDERATIEPMIWAAIDRANKAREDALA